MGVPPSIFEKAVQEGLEEVLGGHMGALIITHRLSTVRRFCTKFFALRDSEALAPGESQLEASAGSFEELYEISPTFRMLADDQGVAVLNSPHPHVETSPEPVSDSQRKHHYVEPESVAKITTTRRSFFCSGDFTSPSSRRDYCPDVCPSSTAKNTSD